MTQLKNITNSITSFDNWDKDNSFGFSNNTNSNKSVEEVDLDLPVGQENGATYYTLGDFSNDGAGGLSAGGYATTISQISRETGISEKELMERNNITNPEELQIGQKIFVNDEKSFSSEPPKANQVPPKKLTIEDATEAALSSDTAYANDMRKQSGDLSYIEKETTEKELSYEEYVNSKTEALESDIADYQKMLDVASEEIEKASKIYSAINLYRGNNYATVEQVNNKIIELTNGEFNNYEEFMDYYDSMKDSKANLEAFIYKAEQEIKEIPYSALTLYDDYNSFTSKKVSEDDILECASTNIDGNGDIVVYVDYQKYKKNFGADISPLEFCLKVNELYPNGKVTGISNDMRDLVNAAMMDDSIRKTFDYFYETKGIDAANKYISDIKDKINQASGEKKANDYIKNLAKNEDGTLDYTDLINHLSVSGKGLGDGTKGFFENIANWFNTDRCYTSSEYESMYIVEKLKGNGELLNFLDNNYEISQSIGNMLPSMALSALTGGGTAGAIALGISAGGGSAHQAMVEGYSRKSAILYGLVSGTSEAASEKLLGGIFSDIEVTSLKTWAKSAASEGREEFIQAFIQAGIDAGRDKIVGKETDITFEDVKNLILDASKSGVYGTITGGILNSPKLAINGARKISSSTTEKNVVDEKQIITQNIETDSKVDSDIKSLLNPTAKNTLKAILGTITSPLAIPGKMISGFLIDNPAYLNQIKNNGLVHITSEDAVSKILDSGYVQASNPLKSYGTPKAYFFAGAPNIGELCLNGAFKEKLVGVKINPSAEELSSPNFQYRIIDDLAVQHAGDYHFNQEKAKIVYYGLDVDETGKLYYKELTKSEYNNYNLDSQNLTKMAPKIINKLTMSIRELVLGMSYQFDILTQNAERIQNLKSAITNQDLDSTTTSSEKDLIEGNGELKQEKNEVNPNKERIEKTRTVEEINESIDGILASMDDSVGIFNKARNDLANKIKVNSGSGKASSELDSLLSSLESESKEKSVSQDKSTKGTPVEDSRFAAMQQEIDKYIYRDAETKSILSQYNICDSLLNFFDKNNMNIKKLYNQMGHRVILAKENPARRTMSKSIKVGMENILGISGETFFDTFRDCFQDGPLASDYETRSLSLLNTSSEEIIADINKKGDIKISLADSGEQGYVVNGNGRHRISILKALYLNEIQNASTMQEISDINKKYTINAQIQVEDFTVENIEQLLPYSNKYISVFREFDGTIKLNLKPEEKVDSFGYKYLDNKSISISEAEAQAFLENPNITFMTELNITSLDGKTEIYSTKRENIETINRIREIESDKKDIIRILQRVHDDWVQNGEFADNFDAFISNIESFSKHDEYINRYYQEFLSLDNEFKQIIRQELLSKIESVVSDPDGSGIELKRLLAEDPNIILTEEFETLFDKYSNDEIFTITVKSAINNKLDWFKLSLDEFTRMIKIRGFDNDYSGFLSDYILNYGEKIGYDFRNLEYSKSMSNKLKMKLKFLDTFGNIPYSELRTAIDNKLEEMIKAENPIEIFSDFYIYCNDVLLPKAILMQNSFGMWELPMSPATFVDRIREIKRNSINKIYAEKIDVGAENFQKILSSGIPSLTLNNFEYLKSMCGKYNIDFTEALLASKKKVVFVEDNIDGSIINWNNPEVYKILPTDYWKNYLVKNQIDINIDSLKTIIGSLDFFDPDMRVYLREQASCLLENARKYADLVCYYDNFTSAYIIKDAEFGRFNSIASRIISSLSRTSHDLKIKCSSIEEAITLANMLKLANLTDRMAEKISFQIEDINETHNINYIWLKSLSSSSYTKTIDGVNLVSESESGLQNLVNFYESCKSIAIAEGRQEFFQKLKGLTFSNITFTIDGGAYQLCNNIFMPNKSLLARIFSTFFHEAGHYLDYINNNYAIGKKYYKKATEHVIYKLDDFKRDFLAFRNSCVDEEELYKKILNEFPNYENFAPLYKKNIYDEFYNRQLNIEMREKGYSSISDIFDALTNGYLHNLRNGFYGHGSKYYSGNGAKETETMANISALYNSGNTGLLYKYFNKEFVDTIIAGYEVIAGIKEDNL